MKRWTLRLALLLLLLPPAAVCVAALGNGRVDARVAFEQDPLLAKPPAGLESPVTVRVVTWNIADAYGFTNNRTERMAAIARVLRDLDADVVGLQEAFIEEDRELLWRRLQGSRLAHQVRFRSATVGNGLWILSAHPIEASWFHRYEHSNAWYQLWEGDWWAGKGIGLARIRLPAAEGGKDGGYIDFYDTHAQAGRGNPANEIVRLGQMQELAEFVGRSRLPGSPGFIVGDFNTRPDAPDYQLAVRETPLERAMTLDSRIDHIFALPDPGVRYVTLSTQVIEGTTPASRPGVFLSRAPGLGELLRMHFGPPEVTALSDHPGYLSEIRIEPVAAGR